jgi:two-component system, cell cycle sensor histidine kinase and response regulator CckA
MSSYNELEEEIRKLRQEIAVLKNMSPSEKHEYNDVDIREYGEAMFRAIYQQAQHLLGILDRDGILKHANAKAWTYTTGNRKDYIGKPFWDAPWWNHSVEEQNKLKDGIIRAGKGESIRFETIHYNSDNKLCHIDFFLKPVRNDSGRIFCLIAEAQDITELKMALEQARQLSNQQKAILNALQIGLSYVKNRIQEWVNTAFASMFGYDLNEISGKSVRIFYANEEDFYRVGTEGYSKIFEGKLYITEVLMKKKNGDLIWCNISGQALNPENPDEGAIWVLQDITEHKKAIEQSKQLASEQKAILNALRIGLIYVKNRIIQWVNPACLSMFNYEENELLGKESLIFYVNNDDYKRVGTEGYKQIFSGKTYWTDVLTKKKTGEQLWCAISGQALNSENPDEGAIWVLQDITESRNAREALRAKEERFKLMLENSNDIISLLDASYNHSAVFGPVEKILGYKPEELIGHKSFDLIHPDDLDKAKEGFKEISLSTHYANIIEFRYRHKDGLWVTLEVMGTNMLNETAVQGIVLNIRDISERKRLQDQLQQAMKMEAVGRLSGGIAHDFNNILTAISGNVDLARMVFSHNDPAAAYLDEVKKAANSAASLTRQLLAFSRRQIIEPKIININDLVGRIQKMLARILGEDIKLETILEEELYFVKIDQGQFEQVLVNLAVNARDAMPDGGKLLIETANVALDNDYCFKHNNVKPGNYVMMSVSDTGYGMTEEVKKNIFEPFFTTKPKGRGTGLGLATIFGTVVQSGGSIEVYSEVNIGTTFRIYLPVVAGVAEKISDGDSTAELRAGHGTVLLVEDETSVKKMAVLILQRLGYEVLEASDGEEAEKIAGGFNGRIDIMMTDVVMPGMNGRELAERLLAIRPEMKILFTSGYTENVIVHHGIIDEKVNFIAKPYSVHELARKFMQVLGNDRK